MPDPDLADARRFAIDPVRVGFDRTGHDDLTQTERRLDHDLVGARRVGGEHHPRAVRADHLLHDDGDRRLVGEPALGAIGHDPLTEQRDPAVDQPVEQVDGR